MKRFDPEQVHDQALMVEYDDGEYVRFEDVERLTDEQKLAVAKILNLLMALAVGADMNEQSHHDIWAAAEAFGISKIELLKAIQN